MLFFSSAPLSTVLRYSGPDSWTHLSMLCAVLTARSRQKVALMGQERSPLTARSISPALYLCIRYMSGAENDPWPVQWYLWGSCSHPQAVLPPSWPRIRGAERLLLSLVILSVNLAQLRI